MYKVNDMLVISGKYVDELRGVDEEKLSSIKANIAVRDSRTCCVVQRKFANLRVRIFKAPILLSMFFFKAIFTPAQYKEDLRPS